MTIRVGGNILAGAVTGPYKANTDMDNLTLQGQNIANWSNNITNCITEIPQDIKLELNDGTLTVKTGSKIYIPNGFEQDGTTPKFDVVTIESDINTSSFGTDSDVMQFRFSNGTFASRNSSQIFSGSTAPTSTRYMIWYDTTNNVIKTTNDTGSTWTSGASLPISISSTVNSSYTEIKQIFNGFGYMGSTIFALPGVKGLIPDGRNKDGSLKSISFEISSIITSTLSYGEGEYYLGYIDGGYIGFLRETITHYLKDENLILDDITGIKHNDWMFFGFFYADSSNKITSFTPKTTFHALDYNDLNSNLQVVSSLPASPDPNIFYFIPEA